MRAVSLILCLVVTGREGIPEFLDRSLNFESQLMRVMLLLPSMNTMSGCPWLCFLTGCIHDAMEQTILEPIP
ncbi:hypothetical protein SDJN02_14312, partial [Cucurbita argyrosperma subsp. argyrosperma]